MDLHQLIEEYKIAVAVRLFEGEMPPTIYDKSQSQEGCLIEFKIPPTPMTELRGGLKFDLQGLALASGTANYFRVINAFGSALYQNHLFGPPTVIVECPIQFLVEFRN
jgi:hypothetical protein